jgi:alkyl hydroperoxide reductase subunit AhpC
MLGVGDKLPAFSVIGVKPKFHFPEEGGESAFETLMEASFPGKWKVIFFYPKDFTFVCPTEIGEFERLNGEFADRDAVVLGGSIDNQHVKLAWRRDHKDLHKLPLWRFADSKGSLVDSLRRACAGRGRLQRHLHRRSRQRHPARLRDESRRRPRAEGHAARPRRVADPKAVRLRPRGRRPGAEGRVSR